MGLGVQLGLAALAGFGFLAQWFFQSPFIGAFFSPALGSNQER
jgi:hypothetical protein